jgi:amino acid transporter
MQPLVFVNFFSFLGFVVYRYREKWRKRKRRRDFCLTIPASWR